MNYTHVVVFFIDELRNRIYLIKKEVPHKPHLKHLHLKLNGFGGGIEEYDENEYIAAERELNEELGINLNDFEVIRQGSFTTSKGVVAVFRAICNDSNINTLEIGRIENEGVVDWYDFEYVLANEQELPSGYMILYQNLFDKVNNFHVDFQI